MSEQATVTSTQASTSTSTTTSTSVVSMPSSMPTTQTASTPVTVTTPVVSYEVDQDRELTPLNISNGVNGAMANGPIVDLTGQVYAPPGAPHGSHNHRSNHRGHSPNRYSPNSGADSPQDPASGSQHVVHVHVNPGETFSVRMGDQIQHIPGKKGSSAVVRV